MSALAPAAVAMFFFLSLVLGIGLLTVNLLHGLIWLAVWFYLLVRLFRFLHGAKLDDCTGYTRD